MGGESADDLDKGCDGNNIVGKNRGGRLVADAGQVMVETVLMSTNMTSVMG